MSCLHVFITTISWVGHFRSPSARTARFLPRVLCVQCVLYHCLQHLCLILLLSLCNRAYFCRWCCDTASVSSQSLAVSTKPSFVVVAEHLLQAPSPYPHRQGTLRSLSHPQIMHSSGVQEGRMHLPPSQAALQLGIFSALHKRHLQARGRG